MDDLATAPLPDSVAAPEASITCAACGATHTSADQVLRCHVAADLIEGMWPCSWMIEGPIATGDPDEPYYMGVYECGAPSRERPDGTGYDCADGHEFTTAQARYEQGWDYAEDDMEAAYLSKYGTEPRDLVTGAAWTRPLPNV